MTRILPLSVEVHAATEAMRATAASALEALAAGEPDFGWKAAGRRRLVLQGMTELQLDRIIGEVKAAGAELIVGAPRIEYRETVNRKAEVDYTHKWQDGGLGEFARIKLAFEPGDSGSGLTVRSALAPGTLLPEHVNGVVSGLASAMREGIIAGFPVVDVSATLLDGAFHDVDSSERSFEIAANRALRKLAATDSLVIVEPIMSLEVTCPEELVGKVIGDLLRRRAVIRKHDFDVIGDGDAAVSATVLGAYVPLSTMFGYDGTLRGMTRGAGQHTLTFSHYEPVPPGFDDDPAFTPDIGMRA